MRKALFLRPFRIVERRKGLVCSSVGRPISVDQILHGEAMEGKSTERMQFETLLDELTDAEIKILTATAQALLDARADSEGEN